MPQSTGAAPSAIWRRLSSTRITSGCSRNAAGTAVIARPSSVSFATGTLVAGSVLAFPIQGLQSTTCFARSDSGMTRGFSLFFRRSRT